MHLRVLVHTRDVVDDGRDVNSAHFVKTELPEGLLLCIGVQRDMLSGVVVAAIVDQPDVVAQLSKEVA